MSTGPMIRFLMCVAVAAGAWGYLSHVGDSMSAVRDDLAGRTRFLIRQAQDGDAETCARLFERYHSPEGDPGKQKAQFERLWAILRSGDPGSVAYAEPPPAATDPSHPQRRVVLRARNEQGQPATTRLDWVQIKGTWYIAGFAIGDSATPSSS